MSGRWWRAYDEAVDDPKLWLLSDRAHRAWFNLMCVASKNDGKIPDKKVLSIKLRMTPPKIDRIVEELKEVGLLDETETGLRPHNWDARQFKSDVSTDRVKRFRKRSSAVPGNVSETPPDNRVQNTEKKDNAADAASAPGKYVFESGCIRLTAKSFNQWKSAFSHLDLAAELIGLTEWAEQQPRWFHAVAGALAKRNREMKVRSEQSQNGADPSSPEFWPSGIPGVT